VTERIEPVKDDASTPRDVLRRSLIAIDQYRKQSGRPILAHLNHTNFQWALTAEDIANTIRIAELGFAPLMGVATDDSHTYHGEDVLYVRATITSSRKHPNPLVRRTNGAGLNPAL
jgi:hypothetical protein